MTRVRVYFRCCVGGWHCRTGEVSECRSIFRIARALLAAPHRGRCIPSLHRIGGRAAERRSQEKETELIVLGSGPDASELNRLVYRWEPQWFHARYIFLVFDRTREKCQYRYRCSDSFLEPHATNSIFRWEYFVSGNELPFLAFHG